MTELPIYAGGLGILAGDTVKAAADMALPFVAVGLLYRGHGVVQHLSPEGLQTEGDYLFDPLESGLEHVYLDGEPLFIKVHLTELEVWLRIWKKDMGNGVILYLLDSETDQNELVERDITQVLYSGTQENLIKQQLILGIGGVKLLAKLGLSPSIYHINEGRPAFAHWQLIRMAMDDHGMSYEQARAQAIQKTVYTNHTLVAAGNQSYPIELIKMYSSYYAQKMGISNDMLVADGIESEGQFSITRFALNVSRKANGVSTLHSTLSKEVWPQYNWVNVTNGVHAPTWQAPSIETAHTYNQMWQSHLQLKKETMQFIQQKTGFGYDERQLIVGWARRIAGYKQLGSLFNDLERLRSILKHADRPVYLLVAGKAHMGDTAGKQLLQEVIGYFSNQLSGSALFVPNYNITIAQHLTRGVDVWLNTPEMGKEACGTSGMKATLNGVINCTVADGWAEEVAWQETGAGWQIDHTNLSESVYSLLENEIAPLYYTRDEHDIPQAWVQKMLAARALGSNYTAERMLTEYVEKLYIE